MNNNQETIKKTEVVRILNEPREWKNVNEELPNPEDIVVIRFWNPDIVCWQNQENIYHLEDIMVGTFTLDGNWKILPPFHKYDYSPLTRKENLKEGTIVTHWAKPDEGEVEAWINRMNYFYEYDYFKIDVDPKNEEAIYQALLAASSLIENSYNKIKDDKIQKELQQLFQRIKDIQYCIDNNQCKVSDDKEK